MPQPQRLTTIELPHTQLRVHVELSTVDARDGLLSCWTLRSEGFAAQGQPELWFTLLRGLTDAREDFPHAALSLFRGAWERSEAGRALAPGDVVELEEAGFAGRAEVRGVAFLPAYPVGELAPAQGDLQVLLLLGAELEQAQAFGVTRVAARLAQSTGHFPAPVWNDPRREPLTARERLEQSALWQAPRVWMPELEVALAQDRVTLTCPREHAQRLSKALAHWKGEGALALLTLLAPGADACLVWQPGQSEAVAVAPADGEGARVGGCFLVLVAGPATRVTVLEDGFAWHLSPEDATALLACAAETRELERSPAGEPLGLALRYSA